MKHVRFISVCLVALVLGTLSARPAAAQTMVSTADIQRLQGLIGDIERDMPQVRARDANLASQMQGELNDLRDDAIYLKVKARRGEPVARSEYHDLRDKIDTLRDRTRGDAGGRMTPSPVPAAPASRASGNPNEVPTGTEFDVRLQDSLSSGTSQVENRFEATTLVDFRDQRGRVSVPAGSVMRGIVSSVTRATRTERTGKMTVTFDRLTISGHSYPMRGTVTQAIESEGIKGEKERIGIGAGVGAILGAILGGVKGALAGVLIGGGGTIAATEGKDVELPAGTVLRVRLDSPLELVR
jgi:hypothetical protein